MPSPQRVRSSVPLDQQSVLPTVRGVPWWGAVLVAAGVGFVGAGVASMATGHLGRLFQFTLLLGCLLAALAVRRRALFTAAAQTPLIVFGVSLVSLYVLNVENREGWRSRLAIGSLLPIAESFPWMALTFVLTVVLVVARWYLTRTDEPAAASPRPTRTRLASRGRESDDAPEPVARAATAHKQAARKQAGRKSVRGESTRRELGDRDPDEKSKRRGDLGTPRAPRRSARPRTGDAESAGETTESPRPRRPLPSADEADKPSAPRRPRTQKPDAPTRAARPGATRTGAERPVDDEGTAPTSRIPAATGAQRRRPSADVEARRERVPSSYPSTRSRNRD